MRKDEFLTRLRSECYGLPQSDIEERVTFYSEMIDDRIEEGFSEEEAVFETGDLDDIVAQIVADVPFSKLVKQKITPKKPKTWEIVLLALGSPIWLSLLIAALAVLLSLYISVWSVILSLWAVFVSLIACALGGIAAGIGFTFGDSALAGVAMIGMGIICAGLSIFLFYGCKAATNGILFLTKKTVLYLKKQLIKKERAS
ncbi:MAG: DUF1700 domain-containing protein [Clostridia bacterium]|nr:DUF1700 domain-containing protein [Clostridia bacterium]